MRAAVIDRYGDNTVVQVRDHDKPELGSNDVLIGVRAAGVNPIDWKIRSGKTKAILHLPFPIVLGNEASGIVTEVGERVTGFDVGDEVFVRVDKLKLGTFAEFLACDASLVALKPKELSHVEAASLPLAGLTAWQALHDVGGLAAEHRVLVHAGAGGVGSLAVQIAAAHGAHVTATASAKNHDLVRKLGATTLIDYRKERFEDHGGDYDIVFDTVGADTLTRSFQLVKARGTLVTVAAPVPDGPTMRRLGHPLLSVVGDIANAGNYLRARRANIRFRYLWMRPDGTQLAKLAELVTAGKLCPIIDRSFPLDEIAQAFTYSATGRARGKIVLEIG